MHPATLLEDKLLKDCEWQFQRRSGPGGQHRNKVQTAAILKHLPTGLLAEANEKRSQAENRSVAQFRLRLVLAVEHRSESLPVSELWKRRVRGNRISVSPTHDDFPALLAELMDHLSEREFALPLAAEHFGVSSSQLIRLLRSHMPAFAKVNSGRQALGLHTLK